MSTFKQKEVTYNGVTSKVMVGMSKLVSPINMQPSGLLTLKNENKTPYRLATVEVIAPSGKSTTMTVQVFGKNIERMTESGQEFTAGTSYLTTLSRVATKEDPTKFITLGNMSHLQNAIADQAVLDELWGDVFTAVNNEPIATTA